MNKTWSVAAVICGLCLILINVHYGAAQAAVSEGNDTEASLHNMLTISEKLSGEPEKLTVKWQGDWLTLKEHPEMKVNELAAQLGLPNVSILMENGHTVYRSVKRNGTFEVRLNVIEKETGRWYAVVQLDGTENHMDELQQLHKLCAQRLSAEGIQTTWNAAIRYSVRTHASVEQLLRTNAKRLGSDMEMYAKESYTDSMTQAISYAVPALPLSVRSDDHNIHMQLAVHQDEAEGNMRITVGFPVITTEY